MRAATFPFPMRSFHAVLGHRQLEPHWDFLVITISHIVGSWQLSLGVFNEPAAKDEGNAGQVGFCGSSFTIFDFLLSLVPSVSSALVEPCTHYVRNRGTEYRRRSHVSSASPHPLASNSVVFSIVFPDLFPLNNFWDSFWFICAWHCAYNSLHG